MTIRHETVRGIEQWAAAWSCQIVVCFSNAVVKHKRNTKEKANERYRDTHAHASVEYGCCLGGGFKNNLFSPLFGEDFQFD